MRCTYSVSSMAGICLILCLTASVVAQEKPVDTKDFFPLFPNEEALKDWYISEWSDVGKPAPAGGEWKLENGVLHGSVQRGTWLVSKKLYSDFIIDFEWKLGERGNSGFGLRFPDKGDPAFDGLEIQMADARYNNNQDPPYCLTAGIYKAITPKEQVYKPTEWNHYQIHAKGSRIKVFLNDRLVQDVTLSDHDKPIERHDNTLAPPLKDRPAQGHIGFQELSRGGTHVVIRNAKIKLLDQ